MSWIWYQMTPTRVTPTQDITVTDGSGDNLTDYQVRIEYGSGEAIFSEAASDGSDIRYEDESGNILDHWIETWDASNENGAIWVKVPSIPSNSSTTITSKFGDGNTEVASDGGATFIEFDNFERSSLGSDYATATTDSSGYCRVNNNRLEVSLNNDGYSEGQNRSATYTASTVDPPITIDTRWQNTRATSSESQNHNYSHRHIADATGVGGETSLYFNIRDPSSESTRYRAAVSGGTARSDNPQGHVDNWTRTIFRASDGNTDFYTEYSDGTTQNQSHTGSDSPMSDWTGHYPFKVRTYAGFFGHAELYVDWWVAREYASTEPTITKDSVIG